MASEQKSFWEHLDELRRVIGRILLCVVILAVALFCFKDFLFEIVLAPSKSDFLLYRLISSITPPEFAPDQFSSQLINTELTGQFMIHMQVSFYGALMLGSPYILWQVFSYVSPALYDNERKMLLTAIVSGSVLFFVGVALSYFLIFPLSFRFLVLYQVAEDVVNMIQLSSYIDTLMLLSIMMGIFFELPLVSILLAKFGFITSSTMTKYRRHAVLAILIIAAIITPTTDIFTLIIVSLPIYVLYEASILAVKIRG